MDIKTNQIGDLLRDQIKNIDNNVDKLDEVTALISEVKEGWDAIPADMRQKDQVLQAQTV